MLGKIKLSRKSLFLLSLIFIGQFSCTQKSEYFQIKVIDEVTGRGIPAVKISPLTRVDYYTDSYGNIAFYEEGLMDKEVYFNVSSDGYEISNDEYGARAIVLKPVAGMMETIKMKRVQAAERLYRITGSGIYRDTEMLSLASPIKDPYWNGGEVIGQDSNLGIIHNGKMFFIWGDTFLPPRYKGNFSVAAATAVLPDKGGLHPDQGIELNYLVDETGSTKSMIKLDGPGYVWFDWLMHLDDVNGNQVLAAKYARVNAFFGNYERGIAIYNEGNQIFEKHKEVEEWLPEGHTCHQPFLAKTGNEACYFITSTFDFSRVRPNLSDVTAINKYDYFTCYQENSWKEKTIDRSGGVLKYGWKSNAPSINFDTQNALIKDGVIRQEEGWLQLTDVNTGEKLKHIGRGSIYWNQYRKKWILISGSNAVWYGEADTPVGPWHYLTKIAEHANFLYNPKQHDFLDQDGGRVIYFEGTYTKFLGPDPTIPRYDYNQIMYRLQMDDPRLRMPAPVYRVNGSLKLGRDLSEQEWTQVTEVAFFALENSYGMKEATDVYQKNGILSLSQNDDNIAFTGIQSDAPLPSSYEGDWDVKIQFEAFDNFFRTNISTEPNLEMNTQSDDFDTKNLELKNDSIFFDLVHSLGKYHLVGKNISGKIQGTWTKGDSDFEGTWSASSTENLNWWPMYNGNLVGLYKVRNRIDGRISYFAEDKVSSEWEVIGNALCLVWSNPFEYLILDPSIKPIVKNL